MFNSIKKMLSNPIKTVASDAFMSTIEQAKNNNSVNIENGESKYSEIFNKGLNALRKFSESSTNDLGTLQEAAEYFVEATELKKSRPEPYFYLAHIFYLLNEVSYALKYIRVVSVLEPAFKGLEQLKEMISGNHQQNPEPVKAEVKPAKPAPGTVTSISYKQFSSSLKTKKAI